jgi:hypothetical protein
MAENEASRRRCSFVSVFRLQLEGLHRLLYLVVLQSACQAVHGETCNNSDSADGDVQVRWQIVVHSERQSYSDLAAVAGGIYFGRTSVHNR